MMGELTALSCWGVAAYLTGGKLLSSFSSSAIGTSAMGRLGAAGVPTAVLSKAAPSIVKGVKSCSTSPNAGHLAQGMLKSANGVKIEADAANKLVQKKTVQFSKGGPPRDPIHQNYIPDELARGYPHTTLGIRSGRAGSYRQGATFDRNGHFRGRTDVTNHGRCDHDCPHWHPATSNNGTKSGSYSLPDFSTDSFFGVD